MKKLILAVAMVMVMTPLCLADSQRIPLNEFSTSVMKFEGGSYTEIGAGINYQKDDGSWGQANAEFKPSTRQGIDWECYTTYNRVGLKNDISSGSYSVFSQLGNTGKILKSKPVALAYLNIDTKEWQIIANVQSSTAVVNGNSIRYNDAFLNCDLEYVIEKDRFKQNLYIKSIAGFPASPYPANKTYVVVVTKFDLANYELPTLIDARGGVAFNDVGDEADELHFTKQSFGMTEATDNVGATQAIKKRIIKQDGNYYLLEGLPYSWLVGATYPVLLDYTTISSNITSNQSWTSGTYYISSSITCNSTISVSAGVIIKFGSGVSVTDVCWANKAMWNINGTTANPVYITSFNDDSVGETISGSSGSPATGDYNTFLLGVDLGCSYSDHVFTGIIMRYGSHIQDTPYGNSQTNPYTDCEIYNFTDGIANSNTLTFTRVYIHDITNTAIERSPTTNGVTDYLIIDTCTNGIATAYSGNVTLTNIMVLNASGTAVRFSDYNTVNLRCLTVSGSGIGVQAGGGSGNAITVNLTNSVIVNNTTGLIEGTGGTLTSTYNDIWNNTTNYGTGTSAGTGDITTDPIFATGTIDFWGSENYAATYFLTQATSPCVGTGSDTSVNIGVNDRTTATDKTLDGGTVDMGYHYLPADVATAGGSGDIQPVGAFNFGFNTGF